MRTVKQVEGAEDSRADVGTTVVRERRVVRLQMGAMFEVSLTLQDTSLLSSLHGTLPAIVAKDDTPSGMLGQLERMHDRARAGNLYSF